MATTTTTVTVDLSKTVGQSSAIEANGSPIFEIEVTYPVTIYRSDPQAVGVGFGRVISGGPVNGYEVGFTTRSIVGEPGPGVVTVV